MKEFVPDASARATRGIAISLNRRKHIEIAGLKHNEKPGICYVHLEIKTALSAGLLCLDVRAKIYCHY
jgi:hypothetical protein